MIQINNARNVEVTCGRVSKPANQLQNGSCLLPRKAIRRKLTLMRGLHLDGDLEVHLPHE